jgi:hypothetical protein
LVLLSDFVLVLFMSYFRLVHYFVCIDHPLWLIYGWPSSSDLYCSFVPDFVCLLFFVQMRRTSGTSEIKGSVAYVGQQVLSVSVSLSMFMPLSLSLSMPVLVRVLILVRVSLSYSHLFTVLSLSSPLSAMGFQRLCEAEHYYESAVRRGEISKRSSDLF